MNIILQNRKLFFYQGWFAVGTINDVAKPGDVAPKEVAGQVFLLTRDRQGVIRVFS